MLRGHDPTTTSERIEDSQHAQFSSEMPPNKRVSTSLWNYKPFYCSKSLSPFGFSLLKLMIRRTHGDMVLQELGIPIKNFSYQADSTSKHPI